MADMLDVVLTVNTVARDLRIEPRETLAEVLRERLGLTGTKVSCDAQVCGACTVLVDDLPVSACTYLAVDADRRAVRTVEGLGHGRRADPAPAGVHRAGRLPVRVLHAGHAHGRDRPARGGPRRPAATTSSTAWRATCAGAPAMPRSSRRSCSPPRRTRGARAGPPVARGRVVKRVTTRPTPPSPIGEAVERRDARAKVTGCRPVHGRPGDARPGPRQAPAQPLPARPHPLHRHGRGRASIPGSSPSSPPTTCPMSTSCTATRWPTIRSSPSTSCASRASRSSGVVAEDAITADEALRLIVVDYEPLPFTTEPEASLADDAPIIHVKPGEQRAHRGFEEDIERTHPNVCSHSRQAWGDIEDAFLGAHLVLEGEYHYPRCYAYAMEPYNAVASWREGELTVWTSGQHPYMVREDLAHCFDIPLAAVRVIVPVCRWRLWQQVVHQDRAADRGPGPACRSPGPARPDHRGIDPDHARRCGHGQAPHRLRPRRAGSSAGRPASCSTPAPTPRTRRWSGARRPTGWAGRTASRLSR